MATRSFTDTYMINKSEMKKLQKIVGDAPFVKVQKVAGHKDVKGKAIKKMLGIEK